MGTMTADFTGEVVVAAAAHGMCSDASSFTTGHALDVDAGYLAR